MLTADDVSGTVQVHGPVAEPGTPAGTDREAALAAVNDLVMYDNERDERFLANVRDGVLRLTNVAGHAGAVPRVFFADRAQGAALKRLLDAWLAPGPAPAEGLTLRGTFGDELEVKRSYDGGGLRIDLGPGDIELTPAQAHELCPFLKSCFEEG